MAAHSPLSAMLVAEAGFDAIWASGFELSAMYGVPDVSVVSMTQHLDMTRAMVDRSGLPVVADIDTGFGNAINVLYVIEQYERAGVAAIVMEDKSFPKVTSLIAGGRQEMVRIEEFQGKIDAARAARKDKDLVLVARTEALIAGLGQDEALKRARAYEAAGADMILVHSKQKTPDEIEAFVKAWDGKAPIALVPTAYPQMTVARVRELKKIGLLIWGNHAIRAVGRRHAQDLRADPQGRRHPRRRSAASPRSRTCSTCRAWARSRTTRSDSCGEATDRRSRDLARGSRDDGCAVVRAGSERRMAVQAEGA